MLVKANTSKQKSIFLMKVFSNKKKIQIKMNLFESVWPTC